MSLFQKQLQQQKLTPQQVQQQKLLQLNIAALEQRIKEEVEQNPLLEEVQNHENETIEIDNLTNNDGDNIYDNDKKFDDEPNTQNPTDEVISPIPEIDDAKLKQEKIEEYWENYVTPFDDYEGYKADANKPNTEEYEFMVADEQTLFELLLSQLVALNLSEKEYALAEEILGNIDSDGYLRRDLSAIVDDVNAYISQVRNGWLTLEQDYVTEIGDNVFESYKTKPQEPYGRERLINEVSGVTINEARKVLNLIQRLDPPAIGSRNLQECLLIQLELHSKYYAKVAAEKIVKEHYEDFTAKHYEKIRAKLNISNNELKQAIELIKTLTPKPGAGSQSLDSNNIIVPDFYAESDGSKLMIRTNDRQIPELRISKDYENMIGKKGAEANSFDKKTKSFIKEKYDTATIFIQLLRERKKTLIAVMQAIADYQYEFFMIGKDRLKPMIYKNIEERTGADKSTISRVVNGKFVQTSHGIYELKSLFTEKTETATGEEISTNVIREEIKKMIENEDKSKPLSDDDISLNLKELGFSCARRTVAKYREQLNIPVARLRKDLL